MRINLKQNQVEDFIWNPVVNIYYVNMNMAYD